MQPPVFEIAAAAAPVTALLGTAPTRLYAFGLAPQDVAMPYAVWQVIYGSPENRLDKVPDTDQYGVQVTVYGSTPASVRDAAMALRDAYEPVAHIVRWGATSKDPVTESHEIQFDVEFFTPRA